MDGAPVQPAYDSKAVPLLDYPLTVSSHTTIQLELQQTDAYHGTTGTTLWLGGQVLSAYLLSLCTPRVNSTSSVKPQAIDLGSGIGLTALTLAACGFDTLATDLPVLVDGILSSNISRNAARVQDLPSTAPVRIAAQVLDWTAEPCSWEWHESFAPSENAEGPAFDVICTSDSIYSEELVDPLVSTIRHLSRTSHQAKGKAPDVYLAYEHRDDAQYDSFLARAEEQGFRIRRIPKAKVRRAVAKAYAWKPKQFEGISIVHMKWVSTGVQSQ